MHNPHISDKCSLIRSHRAPKITNPTFTPTPIDRLDYDEVNICLYMSVLTDFEGFFETEEEFVLYLGDGRLSSPPSPSLSSLFLTSKIIFLQKQRLSNWRSLL